MKEATQIRSHRVGAVTIRGTAVTRNSANGGLGGATYTKKLAGPNIDEPFTLSLHAKHDWAIYTVAGRLQKQL